MWAGYRSWSAVLGQLAQRVVERRRNEVNVDTVMRNNQDDPLLCARSLARYLGDADFGDFIRDEFGPNGVSPHDVIYRLIGLPFRHFMTLNFDPSLEQAHDALRRPCGSVSTADRWGVARFMRNMDGADYVRQVVHLHGFHTDAPDLIALTEQGYRRLYSDNQWYTKFMWLLTVSKRLLFMGFGFQDFDLLTTLRNATRDIQENGVCHFAIVHIRPEDDDGPIRAQLNDRYLIEPIFYNVVQEAGRDDHRGFVEIINGLSDELGVTRMPEVVGVPREQRSPEPEAADLNRAERLREALLERIDPGGEDEVSR